jgi:hypothetical protein
MHIRVGEEERRRGGEEERRRGGEEERRRGGEHVEDPVNDAGIKNRRPTTTNMKMMTLW